MRRFPNITGLPTSHKFNADDNNETNSQVSSILCCDDRVVHDLDVFIKNHFEIGKDEIELETKQEVVGLLTKWGSFANLAFKKKISPNLFKDLNLLELNLSESLTIEELIWKIAHKVVVINGQYYKRDELKQKKFINDEVIKEKVWHDFYQQGKTPGKNDYVDDMIYSHEKGEFREDFLWYIMSNYGNYSFNKLVFEHFVDEHKDDYKLHSQIEYTTEIHKFLYKVVEDENITVKEGFKKVLQSVDQNNIHELRALYILIYELKGYKDSFKGGDDIVTIINRAKHIVENLVNTKPKIAIKSKDNGDSFFSIIKNKIERSQLFIKNLFKPNHKVHIKDIKSIIELIKLEGEEINVENVIKYSKKNKLNFYWTGNASDLYNSVYDNHATPKVLNDTNKGFIGNGIEKIQKNKIYKNVSKNVVIPAKESAELFFHKSDYKNRTKLRKKVNEYNGRALLSISQLKLNDKKELKQLKGELNQDELYLINDCEKSITKEDLNEDELNLINDCERSIILEEKKLLKKKNFINAFETVIESHIEAIMDKVNDKESKISIKKILSKFFSKKFLELVWRMSTFTTKNYKLIGMFLAKKVSFMVLWAIAGFMLLKFINVEGAKRGKLAYEIANGYKFDISPELKNYIVEHVDVLMELAKNESKKKKITKILHHGRYTLDSDEKKKYEIKLKSAEDNIIELNGPEIYTEITNIIKTNIVFQSKSFSQELGLEKGESRDF